MLARSSLARVALLALSFAAAAVAAVGAVGAVAAAVVAATATPARAQRTERPLAGEPPTAGVHLPSASLVGGLDASGLEVNPAALGNLETWSALWHHAELKRSGRVGGGGDALLVGLPLPLLDSLVLGLGLQWLRPADAIGYADYAKLSLGLAWRLGARLTAGLAYHRLFSSGDEALGGINTLDLGLTIRPFEWLGAGVAVHDVVAPSYGGLPLQRVYDVELVARPLSTGRLELGAGLRIGERRGDVDPHFRIEVEARAGLHLYGQLEVLRRDLYRSGRGGADITDVRGAVGFGFSLERVGLAVSTVVARGLDAGPGPLAGSSTGSSFQGVEATLRVQGGRRAPMVAIDKLLLHVELSGSLDGRRLVSLVTALREAERRPEVRAVLLDIDDLETGWANIQELRGHVRRLRRAGKKVYAFLRAATHREYYLAAAADRVLLDPAGGVRLQGLALRSLFFRGTFDLLGVSPQFVRIAEYKSAPEQYTNRGSSPSARQMMSSVFDDLLARLLRDLAADRAKTVTQLRQLLDRGPFTPPQAVAAGLVDELVEAGELQSVVERASGASLAKLRRLARLPERWPVGPGLAVILVEGDIVAGKSSTIPLLDRHLAGDDTVTKALTWARTTDSIKAVVLRVDSPGGSAWASDKIWREVVRTRQVKPVVVSMGDLAASGGYYVASGGQRIFAHEATLTGSIGIFTGKFDLSGLLRKLAINSEALSAGKHALMDSFDRPYTAEERSFILAQLQYYYRAFLAAVGAGRHLTQDQVHRVARGRLWTGGQARGQRLVDAEGGLVDAIEEARRLAGIDSDRPLRQVVLPEEKQGLIGRALELVAARPQHEQQQLPLPRALAGALRGLLPVLLRARSGEPLARLPYHIELP